MEQRQFRRIGFIAEKVLIEIIRCVILQYPAGFAHDFHCGKIAFQRLDRAEMEPLRMPGLIQITVEPGVDVDAFRTAVIDREDTIKLIIGNRPFIFLLKLTRGIVVDNPVELLQGTGIARRFQNTVEQVDGTVPFDVFFHDPSLLFSLFRSKLRELH